MPVLAEGIRWPAENVVSRDNLRKPAGGGLSRCLVDAGYQKGMDAALLLEIRYGRGMALATSLLLTEKASQDPAARRMLLNCLRYAADHRPSPRRRIIGLSATPALAARGIDVAQDTSLDVGTVGAAVLEAPRADWGALATRAADLRAYLKAGGTLYVHRLEPTAAAELSKLLGVPIACEPVAKTGKWWLDPGKIASPRPGHPLTAGIGNFDLNWTVFQHLIYSQLKLPDQLIEHSVSSPAPGAEELTASAIKRACALLRVPVGKGQAVIDQVLWNRTPETKDYVTKADVGLGADPGRMGDVTVTNDGNRRKANRYISTLMMNILYPIDPSTGQEQP
jgi:hypothetical protein